MSSIDRPRTDLAYADTLWTSADASSTSTSSSVRLRPVRGSGGMFVQSEKFIEAHAGKLGDISIYDEEFNYPTWRLANT